MGTPTSPVLSNLATIALDKALAKWATKYQIIFTRFVDDLTFSSKTIALESTHFEAIQKICSKHGFLFNPSKTKYYDEHQTKKVTGLLLNTTVDIDPNFYKTLDKNLKRLQNLAEVNMMMNNHHQSDLLEDFQQEVDGQINFIGMIEGYDSPEFRKYRKRIKNALKPQKETFSARWVNTSYF
jgi:RNA-directed DNA polymerase